MVDVEDPRGEEVSFLPRETKMSLAEFLLPPHISIRATFHPLLETGNLAAGFLTGRVLNRGSRPFLRRLEYVSS